MIQELDQVSGYYIFNNSIVETYKNGDEAVIIINDNPERLESILESFKLRLEYHLKGKVF